MMVFLCVFVPLGLLTIFFFIKWIRRQQKKEQEKEMEIYYAEVERRRQQAYQSLLEDQHREDMGIRLLNRPKHLSIENPNVPAFSRESRISNASSSTEYLVPSPENPGIIKSSSISFIGSPSMDNIPKRTSRISNGSSTEYLTPTPLVDQPPSTPKLLNLPSTSTHENPYTNNLNAKEENPSKSYLSDEKDVNNSEIFLPPTSSNKDYTLKTFPEEKSPHPSNAKPSSFSKMEENFDVKPLPANSSQRSNSDENFPHKYESVLQNNKADTNGGNSRPDQLLQTPKNEERLTSDNAAVNPKILTNSGDQRKASLLLQSDL